MALAEPWHVRSRGRECAATQQLFSDREPIITALFPDLESSGYLRRDYCIAGWKNQLESPEKPFSFWRTIYTAPTNNDAQHAAEKLSAEEILRRLVEEDEDHTENTRFILAVMLERQKLLRETDSQRTPNGIIRVYEQRKSGEIYIVKDPDIPLSQVEAVQNEVIILLENNGRSPAPASETVTPALGAAAGEVIKESTTSEPDTTEPPAEEEPQASNTDTATEGDSPPP